MTGTSSPLDLSGIRLIENGVLLRPWTAEDADDVFRACQDPLILRWTGVPGPYRHEDAVGFVAGSAQQAYAESTGLPMAVVDPVSGELLGAAGLVRINRDARDAEIGFWTAPWARGRRVAENAARAAIRYGFEHLDLRRVVWRADVGNHASRLVAARLGFRFEGVARSSLLNRGERTDAWVGAVLPGELREADATEDVALRRATARSRAFWAEQPTLHATTKAGEPVRLRPLRAEDIPNCVRACQDPDTVRYTVVPHPYQTSDAELFVHTLAPQAWARGVEAIFAIADGDDAFAGSMALRLPEDELTTHTGNVGYLVGPWARGRGYASAALRALTDWGFVELALNRIEWEAYVGNTASRATAERAGFHIEGELRQAVVHRGSFEDIWLGSRLAGDAR